MSEIYIRNPRSEGDVKQLICKLECADDGTARIVVKGKRVNSSIEIIDFLRQIPLIYIEQMLATEP